MGRPRTYEEAGRAHLAFRYNKDLIELFDLIAAKQGMTRTQALDICIKQVVQNGRIPDSYFPELESIVAQAKAGAVPGQAKSRVKDRLLEGSRDKLTDGGRGKTTKLSQSL